MVSNQNLDLQSERQKAIIKHLKPAMRLRAGRWVPLSIKKMKAKLSLLIFLVFLLMILSCKKNTYNRFTGSYTFTTKAVEVFYTGEEHDTTINYSGSISVHDGHTLKINFGPSSSNWIFLNGSIYPNVDDNGNLTYASWSGHDYYEKPFSGAFRDNGNVDIRICTGGLGGYLCDSIHGKKLD